MAQIGNSILGEVKGKIGTVVFRSINGKTFVSQRPSKYKTTNNPKLKNARTGFSNLSAFAAYINSIPILKKVWNLNIVKGKRAYNKIYSHNSKFIKQNDNYSILTILPAISNFEIQLGNLSKSDNKIEFNVFIQSEKYINSENTSNLVLVAFNKTERKYLHQIFPLKIEELKDKSLIFVELNEDIISFENIDNIFCGLTVEDKSGKVLTWTNILYL
ncbi:MAG: hypothetical protein KKF62_00275 [Bacteroidetes bacterium]|nr:hypothetical protein [Bacteroidota bacterium]MBU1114652.1 hypothetical protein [Bacteroidota bacterium]MBU1798196.1 hypothetical protein [Bacteroidota bacterium]